MRVPTYESNQNIGSVNAPRAAGYADASLFVTAEQARRPQSFGHLAAGLDKLNNALYQQDIHERREQLELDLLKDMQEYQAAASAFHDDYTTNHKGADARDAASAAETFHTERLTGLREKYANSPAGLRYIESRGGQLGLTGVNALRDYGRSEGEAYKNSVYEGELELARGTLTDWTKSPEERAVTLNNLRTRTQAFYGGHGRDATAALAKLDTFAKGAEAEMQQNHFAYLRETDPEAGTRLVREALTGGGLSARFESGGDPGAIGYDGNGGTSYGEHQISSKAGSMDGFLKHLDTRAPELAKRLRDAGPANTGSTGGAMPAEWKKIAAEEPARFKALQREYIEASHVAPALASLSPEARAAIAADPRLYEAVFSTAVQHGPNDVKAFFEPALREAGGDVGKALDLVYARREQDFPSSTAAVREGVVKRLRRERAALDAMGDTPAGSRSPEAKALAATLSPQQLEVELGKFETAANRRRAEESFALQARERDLTAAFQQGLEVDPARLPTEAEYTRVYGAEDGPKRYAGLMDDKLLGDDLRMLRDSTPQKQEEMFLARNAEPGSEGYADAAKRQAILQQAILQDRKMREADPAAYAATADADTRTLYEAMQKETTPESTAAYVRGVKASLAARGMPEDSPLLPKAQAAAIAQAFMTAEPQQSAALVMQQREAWGEHWPAVYKQLVKDKENPLPAAAYAIGAGMRPEPAVLLAEAGQNPKFMAQAKETAPEAYKEVEKLLPGVFAPMGESLRAQGGIAEEVRLREQCGRLAMQYVMKGLAPEDAVNKAYLEIGGGRYAFQDGYRVPAQVDAEAVRHGADVYLDKLTATEGALLPDMTEDWRDPKDVDRLTREGVKQNARWVTDPDEGGLVLYRGPGLVLRADGTPVRATWKDLTETEDKRTRLPNGLRFDPATFPRK